MGVEGIGARVLRKEDKRFITGKGRYVDDIRLHGMTYAAFVRSPHAHAKVMGIDTTEAIKLPGVVAVLTGKELVEDKIGNLICGWVILPRTAPPMKMGAWPAMAPDTVRFVGQAVAVVIAETNNQARTPPKPSRSSTKNFRPPPISTPRSSRARRSFIRKPRAT